MNSPAIDISAADIDRKTSAVATLPASVDATPMQILAMAVQRGMDTDKLDKLMQLQERWEANQARKAFEAAISAAKADIKPIMKRAEVDFVSQKGRTHYKYADFAAIAAEVDPVLAQHGLSYRHRSKQDGKRLAITCILAHRDGHFEETTLAADNDESGNKNCIQGIGSTATYLQRYTLNLALGLSAAKDDDGRAAQDAETITDEQAAKLKALILDGRADDDGKIIGNALRYMKIAALTDIPAKNFASKVKDIEAINKNRARVSK